MKREKARAKTIHRVFLFIDIVLIALMPCMSYYLYHKLYNTYTLDEALTFIFWIDIINPIFEVVFSLILALSACYIAVWVTKSTGKNQNTCLLAWHIINLFILAVITTLQGVYNIKADNV